MHIGLLEDNPAIQEYLQTALALNDYRVSIHTFGISLLDALFAGQSVQTSYPYDLVIIDLNLPEDLSGWDVILHIRKTVPPEMLPIIVMSGVEQGQLERLQNIFPDISFIQKPFRLQILLQMLETTSRKQRQEV
jgi:two-component system, OmpR family, phosphate regulon response regulator PhoB